MLIGFTSFYGVLFHCLQLSRRKTDEVKQLESNLVTKIGQNARNPLGMLLGGGNQQNQQQQQHLHQQQQQMLHHQQQPQQQGGAIPGLQGGAEVPGMGPTPGGPTAPPATCQLCLKTKFADGVGHICNYCNVSSWKRRFTSPQYFLPGDRIYNSTH